MEGGCILHSKLLPLNASCTLSLYWRQFEMSLDSAKAPLGPQIAHLVRIRGYTCGSNILEGKLEIFTRRLRNPILFDLATIVRAFILRKITALTFYLLQLSKPVYDLNYKSIPNSKGVSGLAKKSNIMSEISVTMKNHSKCAQNVQP